MATKSNTFRAAALVCVLSLGLAACGDSNDESTSTAGGSAKTKLKVMMFPSQVYRLPAVVAKEKGIFEKHGLDVEFIDQPSGIQGVQAMKATGAQVGQHSLSTVSQGFQSGESLKFFCGAVAVIQTSLVAPPGKGYATVASGADWKAVLKGLEGKKVGIQTPIGSGVQLLFAEALKEAGVNEVTYVNVGTDMATVRASLGNGSIDVAQVTPPVLQTLVADKKAEQLMYLPDGPRVYKEGFGSGWSTPADYLTSGKEALKAYCTSVTEALGLIHDPTNKDEMAGLLSTDMGINKDLAAQVIDDGTYKDHNATLDTNRVESTLKLYSELGIIKPTPEVKLTDVAEAVNAE